MLFLSSLRTLCNLLKFLNKSLAQSPRVPMQSRPGSVLLEVKFSYCLLCRHLDQISSVGQTSDD
jgi:hypothetical protein